MESTNDAKVVRHLVSKLVTHLQLGNLSIHTAGGTEFLMYNKKGQSLGDRLRRTIQQYLKKDDYIIFVIDSDSSMSMHQRRQEPNSLINQIKRIIGDQSFAGKAFFAPAVHELEAWLLIDCLGIFCYFASRRAQYRNNCRDKVSANQSFIRLLRHYQKGNTEHVVETVVGGNGPKEYLEKFSEQVLLALNPNMPQRNVRRDRYHERMSPDMAKHIIINQETLRRNNSLRDLGNVLTQASK
ncbi:MAG: hypothetical protein OXN25_17575 [Candidatus Poribacteria bacterium]|nr:hypothetical protein [Candidatus Poribacteria bacterium]